MGVGFLAMLAGVLNIDQTLYEAAYMDGIRNRAQEIFYITIPSMKPQMLFGAVMAVVTTFQAGGIGVALSGTNPTPQYAGQLIVNHIEDFGFIRYMMGYAAAVSVVLLIDGLFHFQSYLEYFRGKGVMIWLKQFSRDKDKPTRFDKSQLKFYLFLVPFSVLMLLPIIFHCQSCI
jgi:ABC-type sugar transport system permease subunit